MATVTGQTPPFPKSAVDKAVAIMTNPPHEDCLDTTYNVGAKQTIVALTEYPWENNCLGFNDKQYPYYMTEIWNEADNKIYLAEEDDSPNYVANLRMTFDPSAAATGIVTFRAYIDDTVPILLREVRSDYKAVSGEVNALFTFYIGGLIKTAGLKFTYEFSLGGEAWDRSHYHYRT